MTKIRTIVASVTAPPYQTMATEVLLEANGAVRVQIDEKRAIVFAPGRWTTVETLEEEVTP